MIPPAMDEQQRRRPGITPIDVMQPQALREIDTRGRSGTVESHQSVSLFSPAGIEASVHGVADTHRVTHLRRGPPAAGFDKASSEQRQHLTRLWSCRRRSPQTGYD